MKTLFPKQQESVDFLCAALNKHNGALDSSLTGTGKTVVACAVARQMKVPVAVICPKIVMPHWRRELAEFGIEPVFVLNYEKLKRGTEHLVKVTKKMFRWQLPKDTLLIFDEVHNCLPEGTRVATPTGHTPIELLKVGDFVETPAGPRRVTGHVFTGSKSFCIVHHQGGVIVSSHDHKILTQEGWTEAVQITERHCLVLPDVRDSGLQQELEDVPTVRPSKPSGASKEDLRMVRGGLFQDSIQIGDNLVLLTELRTESSWVDADFRRTSTASRHNESYAAYAPELDAKMGGYEGGGEPYEVSGSSGEGIGSSKGSSARAPERREWYGVDQAPAPFDGSLTAGVDPRVCSMGERGREGVAVDDRRLSYPREEVGYRSGRGIPQLAKSAGEGFSEGSITGRCWVERISGNEQKDTGGSGPSPLRYSKVLRVEISEDTLPCYDISVDEVPCFFAEGVLVHNCKGAWTQNTQMLIAAKQAGLKCLLLSATACQDPTEMRAIGYVLGLHNLNRPDADRQSWFGWMMKLGCKKDPWNNWKAGPLSRLKELNAQMYKQNAVKLTPSDLPSAFSDNHIITEPLEFGSLKDIAAFYKTHGVTPEIIEAAMEGMSPEPHILVEILRARQLAEAAKVPDIANMIQDACAEGYSVVVFVNFIDTVKALHASFPDASIIVGGQNAGNREEHVQRFQRNETNVIIANIAAGGVGVSLHDTDGSYPRMSLISPTFNVKDYIQTLGRIHRNGGKSPATQRILVASNTIEEKIIVALEKKRLSMDTLHAQSLAANS